MLHYEQCLLMECLSEIMSCFKTLKQFYQPNMSWQIIPDTWNATIISNITNSFKFRNPQFISQRRTSRPNLMFMFFRFDLSRYEFRDWHVIWIYYIVSCHHRFIFNSELYQRQMELFGCGINSFKLVKNLAQEFWTTWMQSIIEPFVTICNPSLRYARIFTTKTGWISQLS